MNEGSFSSCLIIGAAGQTGQLFLENISAGAADLWIEAVVRPNQLNGIKKKYKDDIIFSGNLEDSLKRYPEVIILALPNPANDVLEVISKTVKKPTVLILPQNGVDIVRSAKHIIKSKNIQLIRASLFTVVSLNKEKSVVYKKDKLRIAIAEVNHLSREKSPPTSHKLRGASLTSFELEIENLAKVKNLFESAGFDVRVFDDYRSLEWTKLIVNCLGSTAEVTGFTPRETFQDKELFAVETDALKSRLMIMQESGISFSSIPWQKISLIPLVKAVPTRVLMHGQNILTDLITSGRNNEPPAIYRKIKEGKPIESRYYHFPFIELGRKCGLRSCADEAILEIITEHEKGKVDLNKISKEDRKKLFMETYQKQLQRPLVTRKPLITHAVNRIANFFAQEVTFKGKEYLRTIRESLRHGKGIIFIANHLSHADHPMIIRVLKSNGFADIANKLVFVAGMKLRNEFIAKLFSDAYTKLIVSTPSSGPVSEEEKRKAQMINWKGFMEASRLLNQGTPLVIYAEGTRSKVKTLLKAIPAVAAYFENQNVEYIVPVAIRGTEKILPVGKTFPRFGSVEITFDKPISPASLIDKALKDLPDDLKNNYKKDKKLREEVNQKEMDYLMKKIAGFLPEEQRGYYR